MQGFKKPEGKEKNILEESPVRRQISLPRERMILRSMKDLESAYQEGLISEELYAKTKKQLLEEE